MKDTKSIKLEKTSGSLKDIKLAMQKEAECLERLSNNEWDADMSKYLADAGYANTEEYNEDKAEYLLRHTDYVIREETLITNAVALPYIVKKTPAFLWMIQNSGNYAFVPDSFSNYKKLKAHHIIPVNMGYNSHNGIILTSPGDLRIVIVINDSIEIHADYFLDKCKEFISRYYESVLSIGNDVIVNGKKIIGSAEILKNGMKCLMFQISYSCDLQLITDICGKRSKIPGCLDSTIISQEKLKDEFIKWLH